jgi:hypothetical protein
VLRSGLSRTACPSWWSARWGCRSGPEPTGAGEDLGDFGIESSRQVQGALQARFTSQIAIPHVEGARALLHRAVDSGELPADTAVDLLLDSLYGAIVIRMILSPPGQQAQLAAEPYRYAAPIVDFVLAGSLTSPTGTKSLPPR